MAKELKMDYLDTDELIARTEKLSINDIFKKKGEPYFRKLETEVIKTLEDYDNFVISTGGGIILLEENVKMLKAIGPLVLLWAEPDAVYARIKEQKHRPLLNVSDPKAEIVKVLQARAPIYNKAADLKVDTTDLKVEEAVARVLEYVRGGENAKDQS